MSHILSEVPGVVQKRAVVEDVSIFNTLLNASGGPALFRATFGQYNYSMLIENSIISLMSVAEVEEKCLGFLVVNDSPTVSMENDTFCAMVASVNTYLPDVIPSNTLFLNFFLVDETSRYDSDKVSFDLVRNAFAIYPQMDYIIWLCPSKVRLGFWMEDNFAEILLESEEESKAETVKGALPSGVRLLYLNRSKFMPKLLARTARVEDNDDLLPILYNSNPQIVSGQSDFFLADLIQSQDGRNKFLVGVHKNKPVGMLASSLDVNVTLITKIFDIDGYPDIIVAKEKKAPPPPLLISLVGDIRAAPKRSLHGTAADMNCLVVHAEEILSMQSSSEEKDSSRSEAEESKMARQAMDCLRAHLAGLVKEASDKAPTACVVVGFPRNDTEAHEMSLGYMKFDVILEVNDESGALDAEGDEEELADPFLRQDRDSIEALRSFTETQNNFTTPWFRVALGAENGSGSVEEDLASCLRNIVHQRAQEVQALLAMDEDEPPQANAFAVTVFCIEDEFQSRADDMLRVAFEDNPSLDYCLYMTSNAARPTLLTASMVIVKQRVGVTFDQSLFIIHRDALIARDVLHVERFAKTQMEAVEAFIAPLSGAGEKDRLKKLCNECLKQNDVELKDNPPEVCFLVMMGADVVGVVTAGRHHLGNDDVNWIRCNYQIDEVINFERHRLRSQAQITNFIMSPAYSKWSRFVIREIMRKYSKTLLYYQNAVEIAPPGEIIDEMIPVAPRRRMQASPDSPLPMAEKPSPSGATIDSPLFYLTKRQISECKTCVPKKVVIIGGGSASYAMLERLLFAPHLNFPNIHLVMELPPRAFKTEGADPSFSYSEKCSGVLSVEDADDPSMRELSAMGIAHRVSIVRGRLTDIDRANKAVVISDEIISEYDLLVIASSTKDCSTKRFPTTSGTHPSHCAFRGMFGLGDAASDAAALTWVKQQSRDRQKVIVYGCDLDAIATVGQLLQQGVDALRITVVISSSKIEEICHPFVVESLMRNLRGCGVYVRMGFEIIDVQLTKFGSIESVTLKSVVGEGEGMDGLAETMTLQCFSLLCSGAKYCDSDVFTAVNDCGIVFDGGMVVDKVRNRRITSIYSIPFVLST